VTDFLSSVLPIKGTYCTVGIRAGTVRQNFHNTITDVDAVGSALSTKGVDAYFALASFQDSSSRKVENASYLRSFFLDLDCGTGKPYADQAAAAQALKIFLVATSLPEPYIVNSGGGLHVYWPLTEDVPAEDWRVHAKALKQLCTQHNLHADPAVTADCARILRLPDTNNYKNGTVRTVQIMVEGQATDLDTFTALLPEPPADLSSAKLFGMDDTTRELVGGEYPKCEFKRIVIQSLTGNGCAQIKYAIDNAATLEEPLWRGALSIATRCEDGASEIHALSDQYAGYTPENTEAKAAETKGPYTCDWYRNNYPDRCKGCTQKVSTPLLIGRIVEESEVIDDQYMIEKPEDESSPAVVLSIPAYPFPYFRGINGGVFRKVRDADGNEQEVEIYRDDLYLTERFFDSDEHGNGDGEMVGINLHMKRDGVRRFFAPVTTLFTKDKLRDLLVKNGVVAYGKQLDVLMAYFASTIRKLQSQYAANKTRNQMGWTPDGTGFVIGELEYTAQGTKLAPPASGTRQLAAAFKPMGALAEWKSIVNFYDRPGLEPHALTLFAGFGSPLLKFIGGKTVKGALIHLKHNGSGSGKSTAQMVANSIFGNPDELLMKQDDTYASKMHMLGMMNSIVYTIDEITNEKPENLSSLAYGVTNGRGRHRMESQSNTLRVNNTTWQNFTVTSGNASIVDKLQQLKSTADGELKRTIEISVPRYTGSTKEEIDSVFNKLNTNYGVAGPVFIDYVLRNKEEVLDLLLQIQLKIDNDLSLDSTHRFYSCTGACMIGGAYIAQKLGLHDIDVARIYKYLLELITANIATVQASVGNADVIAQETLAAFVNENVRNALVANSISKSGAPELPLVQPNGPLRLRYYPDTQEMAIPVSEFRRFFSDRQVDVKDAVYRLDKAQFMKHGGKSHPTRIGAGALGGMSGILVRCYVFDAKALGLDPLHFTDDSSGY